MRTAVVLLVAVSLLAIAAPTAVAEDPGPGGACHVREEYVTEATLTGDPTNPVEPGYYTLIECYY